MVSRLRTVGWVLLFLVAMVEFVLAAIIFSS